MRWTNFGFFIFLLAYNSTYAGVYCNQGEILSTDCGDVDMYGCCDGSAVIFCEPATGYLCKWDCEFNILQPGGNCYGKCGGYKQAPDGGISCGCDPECVVFGDCCDDICDDCADIIPECVDASGSTVCGWESVKGWYDCMTSPVVGPSNHPMQCPFAAPSCTPNCLYKECGPDGCGGSCGECISTSACDSSGKCVLACQQDCYAKNCGPDGCDGVCGMCYNGKECDNGLCLFICTPSCASMGNVCGSDGCGGSCGHCGGMSICENGLCEPLHEEISDTTTFIEDVLGPDKEIAGVHNINNSSSGGSFFIIPYEEPGVKVEEGSSCSAGRRSSLLPWLLACIYLLYYRKTKRHYQ